MFCENCGAENSDQAVVCPKCGVPMTSGASNAPYTGVKEPAPNRIGAIICSVLGFLAAAVPIVGLVLSIIGVSLAGSAKKVMRAKPERYSGSGVITAAQIIGIIGIVLTLFSTIGTIVCMVMYGAGLFSMLEIYGIYL